MRRDQRLHIPKNERSQKSSSSISEVVVRLIDSAADTYSFPPPNPPLLASLPI